MWIIKMLARDDEGRPVWTQTSWHESEGEGFEYDEGSVESAFRFVERLGEVYPNESYMIEWRGEK